jgi:hypothetical protein
MATPFQVQKALAKHFVKEHIVQLCKELIEYQSLGVLCEGRVRQVAMMLSMTNEPDFALAEEYIKLEAMNIVVKGMK